MKAIRSRTINRQLLATFTLIFLLVPFFSKGQLIYNEEEKYTPGHYLAVQESANLSELSYLDEPAIRGVIKRYFWKDLEPDSAVYAFSEIMHDLEYLSGIGKQLVVFITDKSFNGTEILPSYLDDYTLYSGNIVVSYRWHPYVIERFVALGSALSGSFDTVRVFEGIALQESALSLSADTLTKYDYSPEKYRDALTGILSGIGDTLNQSRIIWYMNFLPQNSSYLKDIANAVKSYNVVLSGPDILPYRKGLRNITYPLYDLFHGEMPLACSAQWDSYRHHKNDTVRATRDSVDIHEEGYISMEEIFKFGRDELHLNYIFWQNVEYQPAQGAYTISDAMEVIRLYPEFNQPNTIVEEISESALYAYPNPGHGLYHIQSDSGLELNGTVYDLLANVVYRGRISNSFDISFNPPGIYILVAHDRYNHHYFQKLVIL